MLPARLAAQEQPATRLVTDMYEDEYWPTEADLEQARQSEDERAYEICVALDECYSKAVSLRSLLTLVRETGASNLWSRYENFRKEKDSA